MLIPPDGWTASYSHALSGAPFFCRFRAAIRKEHWLTMSVDGKAHFTRIASRHVYESRISIEFQSNNGESVVGGWTRDLSEGGIRAIVAHELPIGPPVTLAIALPNAAPQEIPARVVWRQGTSYGFQFLTLSVAQRYELRRAVAQQPEVPWQDKSM